VGIPYSQAGFVGVSCSASLVIGAGRGLDPVVFERALLLWRPVPFPTSRAAGGQRSGKNGLGSDAITGGKGSDIIDGGVGNDHLYASDGQAEIISGGPGIDVAWVDRADRVERDVEYVNGVKQGDKKKGGK
jgi:RTX calcium-binding nonapeptide repeat (4 copies)